MNLGQTVEHWSKERANEPALIYGKKEITFTELNKSINRMANGLYNLGIEKEDRVAIMLPNSPEFIYTFYACQKLGAVAVPFNTMYKGREIAHILHDSRAKAVVCLTNFVPLINEIRSELPDLKHIITTGERTVTLADPDSTIFIQAVLSKSLFTDLDNAYKKIGECLHFCLKSIGITEAWYQHRGSIRLKGKKMAGFFISEVEDVYIINVMCFTKKFQSEDFFCALWVPPEVKDKMLEPLISIEEVLGKPVSDEELKQVLVTGFQTSFEISLEEKTMTREEQFGYEKQRSLLMQNIKRDGSSSKISFMDKIKRLFSSSGQKENK